jgi:hypothetical protein
MASDILLVAGLSATALSLISHVPRHDRPAADRLVTSGFAAAIYSIRFILQDNP